MPERAPLFPTLVLAAGASRRMGDRDKLMEPIGNRTLLRHVVDCACALPAPVVVTLPPRPHPRWSVLEDLNILRVPVPDAHDGLSASLRAGVLQLPDCDGVMVLLADLPDITPHHLHRVRDDAIAMPGADILRAVDQDGRPGHPVLFRARLFEDLTQLNGDRGAGALLQRALNVATPGYGATTDLDTPEDWVKWRASQDAKD